MSEQVIDRDTFETLKSMTDAVFLQELIEVFVADTKSQIDEMRSALAQGEMASLQRAAHSLKSNSASFGAARLTRLAREVEMLAKAGTLADADAKDADAKIDALEAEYQKVIPALKALKNG